MHFIDHLLPLLPHPESGGVIALVGAGGKTTALFALGQELAGRTPGAALLTTTTHIFDPRLEPGRPFDQVLLAPELADPDPVDGEPPSAWLEARAQGQRVVLAAQATPDGKLSGIHPDRVPELARVWPFIIIEADGSRHRPVQAPGEHEPVLPARLDLVVGMVGLGCLGQPMDAATVHRPEGFTRATGCLPGETIRLEHLLALARHPHGLFRGVPAGVRRVLLLNQADRCPSPPGAVAAAMATEPQVADRVLVCALRDPRPSARVLAWSEPQ
jgi:probable selenium-dependent hydroxylase accessory protein YqeC